MPAGFYRAEGVIKNVNTIEEYRNLDKVAILNQSGRTVSLQLVSSCGRILIDTKQKIWDAIKDGTIYSCPSLLSSFSVICFADLKKYKFTYQFAFPVLHSSHSWKLQSNATSPLIPGAEDGTLEDSVIHLTGLESTALVDCVQTWRYRVDARQHGFFLAKKRRDHIAAESEEALETPDSPGERGEPDRRSTTPETSGEKLGFYWEVGSLANYHDGFFDGIPPEDRYVCFADPSTYPTYPGWMLRNLLVLIRRRWQVRKVQVLCYRDIQTRRDEARSIVLRLEASDINQPVSAESNEDPAASELPKVTGWERNAAGKVTSKIANLGEYMDPQRYENKSVTG